MFYITIERQKVTNLFAVKSPMFSLQNILVGLGLGEKILETNQNLSNFPPQQNNPQNPLSYIFSPLFSIIPIFTTTKRTLRPSWQSHLID